MFVSQGLRHGILEARANEDPLTASGRYRDGARTNKEARYSKKTWAPTEQSISMWLACR